MIFQLTLCPLYDLSVDLVTFDLIIWNNMCSNVFIFIVLNNISVYLKMAISLDFTAGIYKMKINA